MRHTYLQIHTSPHNAKLSLYTVFVDGEEFCYTENDDDGFSLQIAIHTMYIRRALTGCCLDGLER